MDHRPNATVDPLPEGLDVLGVGKNRQDGVLWDCSGENIAALNSHLNEVTAHWWIWKHPEVRQGARYVGFCHYRRFFRFTPEKERFGSALARLGQALLKERYSPLRAKRAFSTRAAEQCLSATSADGILPHHLCWSANPGEGGFIAFAEGLRFSRERWILRTIELLRETAPADCVDFIRDALFSGNRFYAYETYVARVDHFETMCERLFPAFLKLTEEWLRENEPDREQREPGYIAEAVVGVYWRWLEERQNATFLHCPCFYFGDADGYGKWNLFFSRWGYRFFPDALIRPLTAFHKWLVLRRQKH